MAVTGNSGTKDGKAFVLFGDAGGFPVPFNPVTSSRLGPRVHRLFLIHCCHIIWNAVARTRPILPLLLYEAVAHIKATQWFLTLVRSSSIELDHWPWITYL